MSAPPTSPTNRSAIAVIGMAGRFPGAPDLDLFWSNLRGCVDSIAMLTDRQLAGVDPAIRAAPGYVPARGVLDRADLFDAGFFGFAPREAELMDPQHRLFFECGWEALEDAGYDPARFEGLVGVYAGSGLSTYLLNNLARVPGLVDSVPGIRVAIGNDKDHLPTHLSYKLGLRGPSVGVQTACSTSLVAVHLACQSLLAGECDMALAGGVSVAVPLVAGYIHTDGGILSRDGRCRVFDAEATGTVGGNGIGIVVLRRLEEAVAHGDCIRAVILGSAINNDGSGKVGYTAPSVGGQAEVIAFAQAMAGVGPESISYVEAHGTGTPLGDPIEIAALTLAFRRGTTRERFCAVGSVKSNIGHTDAAAGVAGLIKTVLALQHRELPPTVHFRTPNPKIPFDGSPFVVNTTLTDWRGPVPRRAGVSSFGIGGTNAHVVLEEAPAPPTPDRSDRARLLVLSARSPDALSSATTRLATRLRAHPEVDLGHVAYTLGVGRRAFSFRRAVACTDLPGALGALEAVPFRGAHGTALEAPAVAFLFPGQGAQRPGMARALYGREDVFTEWLDRCIEILDPQLPVDLRQLLCGPETESDAARLRETQIAQPALVAVELALARQLMAWGVDPAAMIGHSVGEYVAACLAGTFSLEDVLTVVAARGRLMQSMPRGEMVAVPLAPEQLAELGVGPETGLDIGAVNEPGRSVVSGAPELVRALAARLGARGLSVVPLHTSHAFHSRMMDPVLDRFADVVAGVRLTPPERPFVSNVSGTWAGGEVADPNYWVRHLRGVVRFHEGVTTLLERGVNVVLEVGPGGTLIDLAHRHPHRPADFVSCVTMGRGRASGAGTSVLEAVGRIWCAGVELDWDGLVERGARRRTPLPTYPFDRRRYWIEPGVVVAPPVSTRNEKAPDIADWFHLPVWTQTPWPPSLDTTEAWLVFTDEAGLMARLCGRRAAGNVVSVRHATRYGGNPREGFDLDPRAPGDYDALLAALSGSASGVPATIVHAWGLDPAPDDGSALDLGLHSLLLLAQALDRNDRGRPVRVVVVTSGTRAVGADEPMVPAKAAVAGAVRVIPQELPQIGCRHVDVPPPGSAVWRGPLLDQLVAEIGARVPEISVALRPGRRWAEVFASIRLDEPAPGSGPPRGAAWLIFGGLGGVGLETATVLATRTAAKIVLAGRSPFPDRERWSDWLRDKGPADRVSQLIGRLRGMEASGGTVRTVGADVTDLEQMEAAVRQAEDQVGPLFGVVFAAGADKTSHPIAHSSRREWEAQLHPKIRGLENLERVLAGRAIGCCLLQSSLSSVLGAAGRAAYAAAHAFMDAFALEHNRHDEDRWRVVDWDNWLTWKEPEPDPASAAGLFMTREEGAEAQRRVLCSAVHERLIVSTGDLGRRVDQWARVVSIPPAPAGSPLHARPDTATEYVEPGTEAERALAAIWGEVLGIANVGVRDNFFDLGGDSVSGISILAKARGVGLRLSPEQLFEHQTVAELALAASPAGSATRGHVDRANGAPLTPPQRWWLEQPNPEPVRFNLVLAVETAGGVDATVMRRALQEVVDRHAVFQTRFVRERGDLRQVSGSPEPVGLVVRDVANLTENERDAVLNEVIESLHHGFDLTRGPLTRVALVESGHGTPARLIWVAHHLLVDATSWRILLEDLDTAYDHLGKTEAVRWPDATATYVEWSRVVHRYAVSDAAVEDAEYWLGLDASSGRRVPLDRAGDGNTYGSRDAVRVTLDAELTDRLRRELPRALRAAVSDLVLAPTACAIGEWAGGPIFVDLEVDARHAFSETLDVSRTVGWFTSRYPLLIDADTGGAATPVAARLTPVLSRIHDAHRRIRRSGIAHGALRAASSPHDTVRDHLRGLPVDVAYLYLGGLRREPVAGRFASRADGEHGRTCAGDTPRDHVLQIAAEIEDGRLVIEWTYSQALHDRATIETVAHRALGLLEGLIVESGSQDGAPAVGDFADSGLGSDDLARLLRQLEATAGDDDAGDQG